jgi:hypothetical protein
LLSELSTQRGLTDSRNLAATSVYTLLHVEGRDFGILRMNVYLSVASNGKLYLQQAVKAHRVVRR